MQAVLVIKSCRPKATSKYDHCLQALEARVDLAANAARTADCKAKGPQRPAADEAAVSEGGKTESPQRETAQMLCKALEQGDQAKLRRELCALQAMPGCDPGESQGSRDDCLLLARGLPCLHAALAAGVVRGSLQSDDSFKSADCVAQRWPG